MTVAELIANLLDFPGDAIVAVGTEWDGVPVIAPVPGFPGECRLHVDWLARTGTPPRAGRRIPWRKKHA